MPLGDNIRALRKKLGMSQEEFAKALGFSDNTSVSNWEKNKSEPDINTLIKIARMGRVSLDVLVGLRDINDIPQEVQDALLSLTLEVHKLRRELGGE